MLHPLSAKIMSSSTHKTKFLLDENVRIELLRFLKDEGYDATFVRKGATDREVAVLSQQEERVLVANDQDFSQYKHSDIYAVIWLRTPQNDVSALINSFCSLLDEYSDFAGIMIILRIDMRNAVNLD